MSRWISIFVLSTACSVYDAALLHDASGGGRGGRSGGNGGGSSGLGGSSAGGVSFDGGRGGTGESGRGGGGTGGEPTLSGGSANSGGKASTEGGSAGEGGDGGGGEGDGGAPPEGGAPASGGKATSGGATSGGAPNTGGAPSTGGTTSGGATSGGSTSGGAPTTGGTTSGGANSGGKAGTGGTAGTGGKGGATGVLFTEDFQTGNASRWTANVPADFAVITDGTLAYREGALINEHRVSSAGSSGWTDQVIEARVKILAFSNTSSASYFVGVCGRYNDENNYYCAALRSDGKLALRRRFMASSNAISTAFTPTPALATNVWYTVRLDITGTRLRGYLDGVLFADVTDTSLTAGRIALLTINATAVFDDVVVTDPTP